MSEKPPALQVAQMLTGYWVSQMIYVAAKLDLAERIQASVTTAEGLARATEMHAPALYRLLRGLASVGIFSEDEAHQFHLTPLAETLLPDVPGSQKAMALMNGEEHYQSWGELLYCVKTGKPGFDKVYGTRPFDFLSSHPEQAKIFDAAMTSIHGRETPAMLAAYDFSGIKVLADVGGGNGSLLIATLKKHATLRGMLYDLPHVIERSRPNFAAAEVADRCQLTGGSFFESIPAGADAYLMRHIIHDWNDDECVTILKNIRKVIPAGGRLLVLESVIPPGNTPMFGKLLDLNMLVIPGGQERTEEEYRRLYAAGGFKLSRIVPTSTEVSVIEGVPG